MNVASCLPGRCKNTSRCCNAYIKMFHMFQMYIASVLSICVHMFHIYVVSTCFNFFRRILHLFYVECFMFQRYVRRGAWIPVCACETEHARAVPHAGKRRRLSPRGLLPRQCSRQSARTRQARAGNGRLSKKRVHAAAVRCARRWFPFPPPSRTVIWHVPQETELRIGAGAGVCQTSRC